MDKIREQLDLLSELTTEQLENLREQIVREFETVEGQDVSSDTISAMEELADAADAVTGEMNRREEQARELAQRKEELAQRVHQKVTDDVDVDIVEDEEKAEVDVIVDRTENEEDVAPENEEEDEEDKAPFATETPAPESASEEAELATAEAEASEASTTETETVVEASEEAQPEAELSEETEAEVAGEEASASEEDGEELAADDEAESTIELSDTPKEETVADTTPGTGTLSVREPEPSIQVPEDRKPVSNALVAAATIVAGGDISGVTSGTELSDMVEIADLMVKKMRSFGRSAGDGEQVVVASIQYDIPEERMLDGDMGDNRAKLDKVVSPEAIMAAGFCAPLEIRYDFDCPVGTTAEPIRDSLPVFGASRGGVRIYNDPDLGDCATPPFGRISRKGGTGNDADDIQLQTLDANGQWKPAVPLANAPAGATGTGVVAATATNVKPCCEFNCTDAQDYYIEALSQCYCFNNFTERFHPELIARNNELMLVQYARLRERLLLAEMDAVLLQYTYAKKYGALRDILGALDVAATYYRHENRYDKDFPLRVILPEWAQALMRNSALNAVDGDFSLTDAEMTAFLRDRNLNVTWSLDEPMPNFGNSRKFDSVDVKVEARLFAEGSFALMDGGTLDLGVIRDSGLVGMNKYCTFTESFSNLVSLCSPGYKIDITTDVCGAASALAAC